MAKMTTFNPWYTCNEVEVGPLGENNELTLSVSEFQRYTHSVKSHKHPGATGSFSGENGGGVTPTTKQDRLPNYLLNAFLIGETRLNYFDERNYIGVASKQYASPMVLQNLERMVVHQDIGYYFQTLSVDRDPPAAISPQHKPPVFSESLSG